MVKISRPFRSVFHILKPTYTHTYGVDTQTWDDIGIFHGSVRSFGGTEKVENGVLSVETTKVVQTNYDTRLTASVRLLDDTGVQWEVLGAPEDLDEKHRFMQFKIRKVRGGAK